MIILHGFLSGAFATCCAAFALFSTESFPLAVLTLAVTIGLAYLHARWVFGW